MLKTSYASFTVTLEEFESFVELQLARRILVAKTLQYTFVKQKVGFTYFALFNGQMQCPKMVKHLRFHHIDICQKGKGLD